VPDKQQFFRPPRSFPPIPPTPVLPVSAPGDKKAPSKATQRRWSIAWRPSRHGDARSVLGRRALETNGGGGGGFLQTKRIHEPAHTRGVRRHELQLPRAAAIRAPHSSCTAPPPCAAAPLATTARCQAGDLPTFSKVTLP
jgi:hypothetical protein